MCQLYMSRHTASLVSVTSQSRSHPQEWMEDQKKEVLLLVNLLLGLAELAMCGSWQRAAEGSSQADCLSTPTSCLGVDGACGVHDHLGHFPGPPLE